MNENDEISVIIVMVAIIAIIIVCRWEIWHHREEERNRDVVLTRLV